MLKDKKVGLIEQDIINLIKYKKLPPEGRKKMVCNQLAMVDIYDYHEFWWKTKVNPELYWELQYLWIDNYYFHTGKFVEKAKREWKLFSFTNLSHYKILFLSLSYIFVEWLMWEHVVRQNYQIYVKIPYLIRNGEDNP